MAFFIALTISGAISCAAGASIHDVGIDDTMKDDDAPDGNFDVFKLEDWIYDAQTLTGANKPGAWNAITAPGATHAAILPATCDSGSKQSPIDIKTASVTTPTTDAGAVMGHGFNLTLDGYLANTGRLLSWLYFGYARPIITGGPLGTKYYALSHINFHFGSTDTKGSEHTIDASQAPMEMQMIFYDGSFNSIQDAQDSTKQDALVGISKLFEVRFQL